MDDTRRDNDDIPFFLCRGNWLTYFRSLHSKTPLNPVQQSIMNELILPEHHKEQLPSLDYLITENFYNRQKIATNKSAFPDKIKYGMIKASLEEMMPSYL